MHLFFKKYPLLMLLFFKWLKILLMTFQIQGVLGKNYQKKVKPRREEASYLKEKQRNCNNIQKLKIAKLNNPSNPKVCDHQELKKH